MNENGNLIKCALRLWIEQVKLVHIFCGGEGESDWNGNENFQFNAAIDNNNAF